MSNMPDALEEYFRSIEPVQRAYAQGHAAALVEAENAVNGLRSLIGPLDPAHAQARAETLDAVIAALASHSSDELTRDSLDAAWAEAEAALPEGMWIALSCHPVNAVVASALNGSTKVNAVGPTPAAALRAMAARLRERAS